MRLSRLVIYFLFALFLTSSGSLMAQDYANSAEEVNPLLISATIPDVSLKNIDGEVVELRALVAEKPTILVFYRGGWCPYCSLQLSGLQKIEEQIFDMGYQLLAISPDRPAVLRNTLQGKELAYTLLSDSPMTVSKAFGIAFKVDQKTVDRYMTLNIDLEGDSGYKHHLLPAPAVYILNKEGKVRFNYVNPDYKERINADVLLAAAKAYYEE